MYSLAIVTGNRAQARLSSIDALGGIGHLLSDIPEDFVYEGTRRFNYLTRRRKAHVDQITPGLGGRMAFKAMVIIEAYAALVDSKLPLTKAATTKFVGRAFNQIVDTELSGPSAFAQRAWRFLTDRARRARTAQGSGDTLAEPQCDEPYIRQVITLDDLVIEPKESSQIADFEHGLALKQFLAQLSERDRKIIMLRAEGLTVWDMENQHGIKHETARRRLQAIGKMIKNVLLDKQ